MANPITVGLKYVSSTLRSFYVRNSSGTELAVFDTDGSLYQTGVAITSSAAELNILDGVTSTAAELNILDGVTATAAELNALDGITASVAELNIMDGVTKTAAEINALAPLASAVLVDPNITFSGNGAHHDYGSGHVEWVLSASEATESYLQFNGTADDAANAVVPTTIKFYAVSNNSGQIITVKTAAGTGIAIANVKSAILYCNGTNVQRITADA